MNHRPPKSSLLVHFFGSICPSPAPFPLTLFIFLSFNHSDFTVSFFFFQLCFLIFCPCCYVTFIFAFCLNLAAHQLLKPPQSICPTLAAPTVTTVTPSVPFVLSPSLSLSNLPPASVFTCVAMLEHLSRRSRSLLSLTLTTLALALSILALCTSYWCEGTHKVVKPLCLSPVKMKNCGQNNSEPYTTGIVLPVSLLLLIALLLYPSTF